MNERDLLGEIFGEKKFKGKYWVDWCDQCDRAIISCLNKKCHGTTCNCGGCDKCHEDFKEFNKYKVKVEDYLTKEEEIIYHKCLKIKQLILQTIPEGIKELNFKELNKKGEFSRRDLELFKKELE